MRVTTVVSAVTEAPRSTRRSEMRPEKGATSANSWDSNGEAAGRIGAGQGVDFRFVRPGHASPRSASVLASGRRRYSGTSGSGSADRTATAATSSAAGGYSRADHAEAWSDAARAGDPATHCTFSQLTPAAALTSSPATGTPPQVGRPGDLAAAGIGNDEDLAVGGAADRVERAHPVHQDTQRLRVGSGRPP